MDTDLVQVARFVRLVENLTVDALDRVDLEELPRRDRTYVHRLRVVAAEDAKLIQRQRVVWLKLRHNIPLLESDARELLQVLGCRGFYFSGLNLDGMVFGTLDLSGGMIVGDYSTRYARVRGWCDERGLVVVGRYLSQGRRLDGELATDGLRVLGHTAGSQDPGARDPRHVDAVSHPSEARSQEPASSEASDDDSVCIEELSEDDIISSHVPPPEPPKRHRSGRPAFPAPPSSAGSLRRSLGPRVGSSRCTRSPRGSVPPRSVPSFSVAPGSLAPEGEASPDTTEIDAAWE